MSGLGHFVGSMGRGMGGGVCGGGGVLLWRL